MTTRTQRLVDVLRFRIVEGELVPGQAVPSESELVAEFGVSRTVVREAMSRLQAAGLVETLRGKGSFVLARPSEQSFGVDVAGLRSVPERVELLEFRLAVETEAAALAAVRHDEAQLEAVRRAAVAFAEAADRPADAVGADFRFHAAVATASGNRYLLDVLRTLGEPMIAMPAARLRSAGAVPDVVAEHEAVLRALERRDPETARAAVRVHLAASIARLGRG